MKLLTTTLLLGLFCFAFNVTLLAQSNHTITIDGTNDFTASSESFDGTSGSVWSVTWDATNLYIGLVASDVSSGNGNIFAYAYIDTDPQRSPQTGNGTITGVTYNSQTPGLPFNADYHLRWKADNTYTNMLDYDGSSWTNDNTTSLNFGITLAQNSTYLEIAIPRASLGNPSSVYIAAGMLNETGGTESTFFLLPSDSNTDGFDANHNSFYGFDLSENITPNATGVLNSFPTASSVVTGNFNDAGTWTNGIPTSTDNAIIKTGHTVTLDATATVETLNINSGGTFIGSDGTDRILNLADGGSFNNNGTFTSTINNTVDFNGAGTFNGLSTDFFNITTQGGDVIFNDIANVYGLLNISGAGNVNSGGNLEIKSDATNTGMVTNASTGVVTGDVIVERHLTNQANDFFFSGYEAVAAGYHYISYPVSDGDINELSDDLTLVITHPYSTGNGGAGNATTPFPNLFKYDETLVTGVNTNIIAWDTPANTSEAVNAGEGFVFQHTNNSTIDISGTLNNTPTADGLAVSLTRTQATGTENGWNLVGNPYPAPITWASVAKTNVEATIYMQIATEQYNGVWMSTNGTVCNNCDNTDANTIPMMQGFFVRVASGNTTGSIAFDNADRKTAYENPAFYRTAATVNLEGLIKLKLSNLASTKSDETIIALSPDLSSAFDVSFDGSKNFENATSWPNIFTQLENGEKMSINGLGTFSDENYSLALSIEIAEEGQQRLSVSQFQDFDPLMDIYLEDKALNQLIDLRQQESYEFDESEGLHSERFVIHFRQNRVTGLAEDWTNAGTTLWTKNQQIHIKFDTPEDAAANIKFFDVSGKQLWEKANNTELELTSPTIAKQQIVIVKVENEKGLFVKKLYLRQ